MKFFLLRWKIIIVPNLASDNFSILNKGFEKIHSFTLLNYEGKIIASHSFNPHVPICLYGISKGIYFVKIKGNGQDITQRLLVVRP